MIDGLGGRIRMAVAPGLAYDVLGAERMSRLAETAVDECVGFLGSLTSHTVRLALALPERCRDSRRGDDLSLTGRTVRERVRARLEAWGASPEISVLTEGRAAGAYALAELLDSTPQRRPTLLLLGGVDTYLDWDALAPLAVANRIATLDEVQGLIPGEAAAFVALSPPAIPSAGGRGSVARVTSACTAIEPSPNGSGDHPSDARGLSDALRRAVKPLRDSKRRSAYWFTDVTNEAYGLRELQILFGRFGDVFAADTHLETHARELGDVGAATMPLQITLAAEAWARGYAPDTAAICIAGSDGPQRGAVLLEAS